MISQNIKDFVNTIFNSEPTIMEDASYGPVDGHALVTSSTKTTEPLLPKDLLKDARKLTKEEIMPAISRALERLNPRPMPNPIPAGQFSMPIYTTGGTVGGYVSGTTTIGTITASSSSTINGVTMSAGDTLHLTSTWPAPGTISTRR